MQIRPVRAGDKELIRRGFDRLSPETRYQRFFVAKQRLLAEELRYFSEVDQVNHLALLAVLPRPDGGEEPLGIARAVRLPDPPHTFEVAVTIVDAAQGRGLGRRLVERVLRAAAKHGARQARFTTLPWNRRMRALVRSLGLEAQFALEDDLLTITVAL
jgi:GNAT superfamily N-acetyltransferase